MGEMVRNVGAKCLVRNVVTTSPNEIPGMPFGDVTKFRAKSCEREENAWVLGWSGQFGNFRHRLGSLTACMPRLKFVVRCNNR